MTQHSRIAADPAELALRELRQTDYAVALARVLYPALQEARAWQVAPHADHPDRAAYFAILDTVALCENALEDLIFLACQSQGIDRGELPSTGEMVDRLGVAVASAPAALPASGPSPQAVSALRAAPANARRGA